MFLENPVYINIDPICLPKYKELESSRGTNARQLTNYRSDTLAPSIVGNLSNIYDADVCTYTQTMREVIAHSIRARGMMNPVPQHA